MTQSTEKEREEPIKMQPGDDLHLTMLMAPHGLNFVTGKDREQLLAWGRDVWQAAHRAPVVPDGWKLVPTTPTKEQLRAGYWSGAGEILLHEEWARKESYERMLAAAPTPQACNPSMQPELATKAAPVELPEPDVVVHHSMSVNGMSDTISAMLPVGTKLYTAPHPPEAETLAQDGAGNAKKSGESEHPCGLEAGGGELPEPVAYLYHGASSIEEVVAQAIKRSPPGFADCFAVCVSIGVRRIGRNETPLYTEQQVRALLESHSTPVKN